MPRTSKAVFLILILFIVHQGYTQQYDRLTCNTIYGLIDSLNRDLNILRNGQQQFEFSKQNAQQKPNPELEAAIKNSKFSIAEVELGISQRFERGDKVSVRLEQIANQQQEVLNLVYERRASLKASALRDVISILLAEEKIVFLDSLQKNLNSTKTILQQRLASGTINKLPLLKTMMEIEKITIERNELQSKILTDKKKLPYLWSDTINSVKSIHEKVNHDFILPPLDTLKKYLSLHPSSQAILLEQKICETEIKALNAESKKDVTVALGIARENETGENKGSIGLSIELPVFANQKAAISQQNSLKNQIENRYSNNLTELTNKLDILYRTYETITKKYESIQTLILPYSQEMSEFLTNKFELGTINILDIIDLQIEHTNLKGELMSLENDRISVILDIAETAAIVFALTISK